MAITEAITISSSPPHAREAPRRAPFLLPSSPHTSPFFGKVTKPGRPVGKLKSGSRAAEIPQGANTGFQAAKDVSILDGVSKFTYKNPNAKVLLGDAEPIVITEDEDSVVITNDDTGVASRSGNHHAPRRKVKTTKSRPFDTTATVTTDTGNTTPDELREKYRKKRKRQNPNCEGSEHASALGALPSVEQVGRPSAPANGTSLDAIAANITSNGNTKQNTQNDIRKERPRFIAPVASSSSPARYFENDEPTGGFTAKEPVPASSITRESRPTLFTTEEPKAIVTTTEEPQPVVLTTEEAFPTPATADTLDKTITEATTSNASKNAHNTEEVKQNDAPIQQLPCIEEAKYNEAPIQKLPSPAATEPKVKKPQPRKARPPAKSSRTVTGIALAAYRKHDVLDPSHLLIADDLSEDKVVDICEETLKVDGQQVFVSERDMVQQEQQVNAMVTTNETMSKILDETDTTTTKMKETTIAKTIQTTTKKKRERKPTAPKGKKKRPELYIPKLPTPETAIQSLAKQDWLFGTSSQLIIDESDVTHRPPRMGIAESKAQGQGVSRWPRFDNDRSNSKLWDIATFATKDVEYLGSTPTPKLIVEDEQTPLSTPPQLIRQASPPGSVGVGNTIRLTAPSFARPKPTLLCASTLTRLGGVTRPPLASLPANTRAASSTTRAKRSKSRSASPARVSTALEVSDTALEVPSKPRATKKRQKTPPKEAQDATLEPSAKLGEPASKKRGRPRKKDGESKSLNLERTPEPAVKKRRGRPPKSPPKSPPTSEDEEQGLARKVKLDEDGFEEIDDSEAESTPSPPRAKGLANIEDLELEQPEEEDDDKGKKGKGKAKRTQRPAPKLVEGEKLAELKSKVFPEITRAVKAGGSTRDPSKPTFLEKMLLYDPIVLEDLTAWLNDGRMAGIDQPLHPSEVQKWCEDHSICCIWREGLRGGVKLAY